MVITTMNDNFCALREGSLHERIEDGTLPFHLIFALDAALTTHEKLFTSMIRISIHTGFLTRYLYNGMIALSHRTSSPLFKIYNESSAIYGDTKTQGATIACYILRSSGVPVSPSDVERAANEKEIYIRSGSLCNPGEIATYLGWTAQELRELHVAGRGHCGKPDEIQNGKATGVVRVSLGAMSKIGDVDRFLSHVKETYLEPEEEVPLKGGAELQIQVENVRADEIPVDAILVEEVKVEEGPVKPDLVTEKMATVDVQLIDERMTPHHLDLTPVLSWSWA
jgi:molybdenum cofactor sulfurtransferase